MIIILEIVLIVIYSINPIIGFIGVTVLLLGNLLFSESKNIVERIFEDLFYALPFSYQSFFKSEGATYINYFFLLEIVLLFICIINLKAKRINKTLLVAMVIFVLTFVRTLLVENIPDSIIAVINFWMMILLPVVLLYSKIEYKDTEKLKEIYKKVSMAMAMALIVSYILYQNFGILIGNVTFFGNEEYLTQRVNFNLLFNSYSSLSAYLSIGSILMLGDIMNKKYSDKKIKNIFLLLISIIAVGLSSSRTGLVTFIIIALLMFVFNKEKKNIKSLILVAIVAVIGFVYMIHIRPGSVDVFDNNGRFERWAISMDYFKDNVLFGTGFRDSTMPLAHNFVLEYLTQGGIIIFLLLAYIMVIYLKFIKNQNTKYLVWAALFANLFFTCLHGQTYFNLINVLLILQIKEKEKKIEQNSRDTNFVW